MKNVDYLKVLLPKIKSVFASVLGENVSENDINIAKENFFDLIVNELNYKDYLSKYEKSYQKGTLLGELPDTDPEKITSLKELILPYKNIMDSNPYITAKDMIPTLNSHRIERNNVRNAFITGNWSNINLDTSTKLSFYKLPKINIVGGDIQYGGGFYKKYYDSESESDSSSDEESFLLDLV